MGVMDKFISAMKLSEEEDDGYYDDDFYDDIAQRIIDFTSGSCFAMSGNLQKISHYIFIITPASVDISGDFQDILSGSFDVPIDNGF